MKRVLLLVVAAAIAMTANAKNYYFSTKSGDDSRTAEQAQHTSTPWKTLNKLNAIFVGLQPGDSVLFNRGEIFPGSFTISKSGYAGAPIVISAYGSGARPEFTGFTTVNNWTATGNNIWEADCANCVVGLNTVVIDNSMRALGRYPNANTANGGHLTLDGNGGKTNFYDNELNSNTNWTGAEVVIRKNAWIIDRAVVTGHSGGVVSYDNTTGFIPLDRHGYFFQNDIRTLDQDGEWYFNPGNHKLYIYSETNPFNRSVRASTQETVVECIAQNYITMDNVQISGGNLHSLKLDYAHHFTLQNSDVLFSGTFAVKAFITDRLTITNTNVNYAYNNGIYAAPFCSNSDLSNNRVHNIGLAPGMGRSHNQTYEGISVHGTANMIQRNKVDSVGYIAIRFLGDYSTVQENVITDFLMTKDDGGGIYTNGDNEYFDEKILNNVLLRGHGAPAGTYTTVPNAANGIYVDDKGSHIEIIGNTVAHCSENGIFLHNAHEIVVKNNTLFDNKNQVAMIHDILEPMDPIRNIETDGNIFFSKTSSQLTSHLETMKDDLRLFGRFDKNYYCRPINESMVMKTRVMGNEQSLNFENWQQIYQQDQNGGKTPGSFDPYTYKVIGNNLFSNGAFNSNLQDASSFSIPYYSSLNWTNEGQLDGGAMKVSYNTSNGSVGSADVILNISSITAGKTYVLTFDMLGINDVADLDVFMRNNGGNYNNLSEVRAFKNSNVRTSKSFLFHATESCSSATLVFRIFGSDCPLYLDNINLSEAQVTTNSVDEFVRFEYNSTASPKTIALQGEYMDVEKNQYSQTITLAPFSSAILMLNEQASLPLRFVEFKGKKNNQQVDLKWITANEVNTSHFEIEKSANGVRFEKIGRVNSSNVATGTSNYTFSDYTPFANKNYYRLKQLDKDGKSSYSDVVMIGYAAELKMNVSPNPATDKIRVVVNTPQTNQKAVLTLHTLAGVTVKSMPVTLSNEATTVDLTGLAAGIYVVHVAGEGINFNERIVKK
jgi:parallel beta-helix repeat protein